MSYSYCFWMRNIGVRLAIEQQWTNVSCSPINAEKSSPECMFLILRSSVLVMFYETLQFLDWFRVRTGHFSGQCFSRIMEKKLKDAVVHVVAVNFTFVRQYVVCRRALARLYGSIFDAWSKWLLLSLVGFAMAGRDRYAERARKQGSFRARLFLESMAYTVSGPGHCRPAGKSTPWRYFRRNRESLPERLRQWRRGRRRRRPECSGYASKSEEWY